MICPQCGKRFTPFSVVQKYCSKRCGEKWRQKHQDSVRYPSIMFRCSYCGHVVVTNGLDDRRTRFCCDECCKKYWRHPPQEHSALTNDYAGVLEWRERKDMEEEG